MFRNKIITYVAMGLMSDRSVAQAYKPDAPLWTPKAELPKPEPRPLLLSVGYVPDEATRARLLSLSPAERLEKLLK